MKIYTFLLIVLFGLPLFAQEQLPEVVDSLYREDQLYAGVTFNLLSNGPSGFSQNGLSAGLQIGFIRDFPINKRRNKALGVGIGLAADTYNQNLRIGSGELYSIIPDNVDVSNNRFTMYTVEFPLEYRWRTSTPSTYSFWRIHAGVKFGYILDFQSTYEDATDNIVLSNVATLNKFQYGPSFSFGYGAFNFQGYYGLNTLFSENAQIGGKDVGLQVIRLGLVFYFL